jgi:transcriptional regulator with XRE-family HTH domain
MRIGENIKAIRQSKNMTQEELAGKIYTTRQTVSNYEKGRSDPDLETIKRIAEALETDASVLLYGDGRSEVFRILKIVYQTLVPFVLVVATGYLAPIIVANTYVNNDPVYWGIVASIGVAASCVVYAIIRKDGR